MSGDSSAGIAREAVRAIVRSAGFDRVGFASAGPAPSSDRFRAWAERGFAGEMRYMTKGLERRADPRLVLEGARTVISAAVHYREPGASGTELAPGEARIASYAQGKDYHLVLERRLKAACATLKERFPASYRWYVDTGPVLERDWAQAAGIGWIGKNTCAIDPERGSYFFIAVILTTLDLEPDEPSVNHCGTCRACIDACPTAALVAPYELDARLCISYLTIEHRGPIPPTLAPKLGDWVFGCDVCQDVCPFNQRDRAGTSSDFELAPRQENVSPRLEGLATLDEESFRARFPQSPVRRAKHEGFRRNVLAALRNSAGPPANK